jgi:uncharacterized protein (DUF58 family)
MQHSIDFQLLERLTLHTPTRLASRFAGNRPGTTQGHSLEFADHRPYYPGDDVHAIDWTVSARLGKRMVRLFHAEAQLDVHILLDTSNSMHYGSPDKLTYAKHMVTALGYVATRNLDRVSLTTFTTAIQRCTPLQGGPHAFRQLLDKLAPLEATGVSNLHQAFREYAAYVTPRTLVVIVSDFFAASGYREGLQSLLAKKCRLMALQVLADEELAPQLHENTLLRDLEEHSRPPVALTAEALQRYRQHLASWIASFEAFCKRQGVQHAQLRTAWSLAALISHLQRVKVWHYH